MKKGKKYNVVATAYAQYTKDFNKANHFDITAGYEYSHMKYWGDKWSRTMYPSTYEGKNDKGEALAGTEKAYDTSRWRGQTYLVSWYGRANYSLLDRYLLTFTARYDGSSRFADGHRWGFFPAAAFAWRVKEESFLKEVDAISDLKLRLGWGKTGQQDTGREYYTATYKKSTSNHHLYPIGGGDNTGLLYRPLAYNDDLTWETTTTWNVGLDYGMFDQRLVLNFDAYYRKTTDLLSETTIPAGQNFDNKLLKNAGTLENKGFEVAVTGRPIQTKDWFVELSVNAAYNKNEITEITDVCSYYIVDREFADDASLPIGFPCENTQIIVLNEDNKLVQQDEIGELCVKGSCLSMGYYKNPEKSRDAFVQNPLNDKYAEQIYRTGDLVRYNEFGELMYVGRKDYQIKHQGHRIELGEIETAAGAVAGVKKSCALYNDVQKKIVLFCEGDKILVTEKEIYKELKQKVPHYMLPAKINLVEELPLNVNGKIDRVKLKEENL